MRIRISTVRSLPSRAIDRLVMKPWVHQLLLPLGHDIQPRRWVFVIGSYNAGTTLLASVLGQHPALAGMRTEGVYLADGLPYPELYGWPRMWCQCLEQMRIAPEGGEELARRIRRQWSLWYPRGAENLLEKSVANAVRMPFLEAYFQPAYFLYIIRNGYAVAAGIRDKANLRRWRSPYAESGYPMELCARQWLDTDTLVAADSRGVRHFHTLYYEELVTSPERTLGGITDFLGLAPLPSRVLQRSWNVHGIHGPIRDMNANSLKRLSAADVDVVDAVAGERLRWHGYQRPDPAARQ